MGRLGQVGREGMGVAQEAVGIDALARTAEQDVRRIAV
jgi:hypothetical protein